jgi:predicted NAD-dependent protein-ADP-ribosyltransferase YbiA (DUF1768 family)
MDRMPGCCTTRSTPCCTRGRLYPTGPHLFEACKSLDRRPDVARRIRQCSRVEEVTAISGELRAFTRPDWAKVALVIVSNVSFVIFIFIWINWLLLGGRELDRRSYIRTFVEHFL